MSFINTAVADLKGAADKVKAALVKAAQETPVIASDVVNDAEKVAPFVQGLLPTNVSSAISKLGSTGETLLSYAVDAVEAAGADATTVSVPLTQEIIADIKAIASAAKSIKV